MESPSGDSIFLYPGVSDKSQALFFLCNEILHSKEGVVKWAYIKEDAYVCHL